MQRTWLGFVVGLLLGACFTPVEDATRECIAAAECDDGDPQTVDTCDASGRCAHAPLCPGESCPAGCTSAADCDDEDAATVDTCGEDGQCAHLPLCPGESCPAGCRSAADCDDGDAATLDSCDAEGQCAHLPLCPGESCPAGCRSAADCDDGDAATVDTCDASGRCAHAPLCPGESCPTDPCAPGFPAAAGLRVAVLDVGQGDAIAVLAPGGCAALVDGGPAGSGKTIKSYLAAQGIRRLDFAVASHYHADHIGGLDEVAGGASPIPVARVYDRGPSTSGTSAYSQYAASYASVRREVRVGETWTLCDQVCFQVMAVNANGARTSDENARSVVVKLSSGPFSMLLGGDLSGASPDVESAIAAGVGEVDVYKVHHHGSATSSTAPFLASLRPSVSLVSVGWSNSYGHPAASTLFRLQAVGSAVWSTEEGAPLGPVEVRLESGARYSVSQGASRVEYAVKGAR